MDTTARHNTYDVVIVGGGLGGLTAGALLAKEGKKVLLVEQEEQPGGFARDFQYGPYNINPALHVIMGCNPSGEFGQGIIDAVLSHLGVQDKCEFVSVNPFYRARFPGFQLDVPTGREAYLDAHLEHFPGEAQGMKNLVNLCSTIFREFMQFPSVLRLQDWALMPIRFPAMFRHAAATLDGVMNRYLSDPKLKSVYAILHPYLAAPPSRLSFLLWAVMMASYIEQGAFYCQGGFQNLVNALAEGMTAHGGESILRTRVRKIQVINGHVRGIVLDNGQEIASPLVISNIDARTTFDTLLDAGQVPSGYLRKLRRLETSGSLLGLYLATDLDVHALEVPKVTMISSWDLEKTYSAALHGPIEGMAVHIPTIADPSLAPEGEHIVVLQTFVPNDLGDFTPDDQARFAERLIGHAEEILPGLRKNITFIAGASEENQQQYPLHRLGPIYGWANSVSQAGPRRLPQKTPISGLYLAGHWTQPGSGIWTVVSSGINAARYILGKNMSEANLPLRFQ